MQPDRFEELLRAWQDGDASPAELAELAESVQSDPSRRRALVEAALLEAQLYSFYGARVGARSIPEITPEPASAARPSRRKIAELAAAGILLAVCWAGVAHLLRRSGELREGQTVAARNTDPLALRFPNGAEGTLQPGATGRGRADGLELESGRGRFRVPGGSFFRVVTPTGTVEASGAEFEVTLRTLPGENRPELVVAVGAGEVRVEAWGFREIVPAGRWETFGPPSASGARYARLLEGATLTLADALERAGGQARAAKFEEDEGRAVYAVEVVREGRLFEVEFDARTGERLEEEPEGEAERVPRTPLSLGEAIRRALAELPGRAVEAQFRTEGDRTAVEIKVLYAGRVREIKVDADTGRIVGR
ncbi:MAG: PepSY domain-containing protein [Planctomycetota bacterium]